MPKKDSNKNIEVLLNTKNVDNVIKDHKTFYGSDVGQMPLIIKEGRIPLNIAGLMRKRLEILDSDDQELVDYWWDNCFDTGDAIIYHLNGNLKIVLNAEPMKYINPKSKLKSGALIIPKRLYNKLDGEEFIRKKIKNTALQKNY